MEQIDNVLLKKQLPQDIEIESNFLACCFIDQDFFDKISDLNITPHSFAYSAHGVIYEAILALVHSDTPIDLMSIKISLEQSHSLSDVGGVPYLAELLNKVSTSANLVLFAESIEDKALRREMIVKLSEGINMAYDPSIPAKESLSTFNESLNGIFDKSYSNDTVTIAEACDDLIGDLLEEDDEEVKPTDFAKLGFREIDNCLAQCEYGKQYVIAGRPGMGKSTLSLNMIVNLAKQGEPCAIFTLEMNRKEVLRKLVCRETKITEKRVKLKLYSKEERQIMIEAYERLKRLPIYINDSFDLTPAEHRVEVNKLNRKYDLKWVLTDHIGLPNYPKKRDKREEIGDFSTANKRLAGKLGYNSILVSQLNRECEKMPDKQPLLSHLAETATLEWDADVIMFIHNDAKYEIRNESGELDKYKSLVKIPKNRGGETGNFDVYFDGDTSTFRDYESAKTWDKRDNEFEGNKQHRMGMKEK